MKKLFLAMALICACSTMTFAQEAKGEMGVKIHTGMTSEIGAMQGLIGLEFRAAVADKWRIVPSFNIGGGRGLKYLDLTVDAHYVFRAAEDSRFSFYPIAGVGFFHTWTKSGAGKSVGNRFFANAGLGGQYDILENIAIIAEAKSTWTLDYNKGTFLVGVCYKF